MRYFIKKMSKENVTLTAYIHDKSSELSNGNQRPAILIFPGGGYFMCSDREAEPVALAYMAEGYQAFVLRYSVGKDTPFQDSYDDALEAFAYLKDKGNELGINTDKIAVAGFSAGGHLAASLAAISEGKPSAMVLGYPVILDEMGSGIKKDIPSVPDYVTKQTPPSYIFTTSTDELVPIRNSLKMAEALDCNGIPFELHIFPNGQHGLSLAKAITSDGKPGMVNLTVEQWFQESIDFLKGIWGDFDTDNEDLVLGMDWRSIGIDTPLNTLLEREDCKQILLKCIPGLEQMLEMNPSAGLYSLNVMNQFSPEIITDEMLSEIEKSIENHPR